MREIKFSCSHCGMRLKTVAAAISLALLVWAGIGLVPRAWNAGRDLLGVEAGTNADLEPEFQAPDISPERIELVRQHQQALSELARAYQEMATGYAQMRNPRTYQQGQEHVARASQHLETADKKGAALPKLDPAEKAALGHIGRSQLLPALAQVGMEIGGLKQTPGLKGDFDRLLTTMTQARKQLEREFPSELGPLGVLLVISQVRDGAHLQVLQQQAKALADDPSRLNLGVGVEGSTCRMKLAPALSARACAGRITFGKVVKVSGRRIDVTADVPSAKAIAQPEVRPSAPGTPAATPTPAPPGHKTDPAATVDTC